MVMNELTSLGDIHDFFQLKSKIFTTNNADIFNAIQKETGRKIFLSVLKKGFSFTNDTDEISNFLSRLERIKSYSEVFSDLINFAIDKNGIGYGIIKASASSSIFACDIDYREIARRVDFILRILVKMHSDDIVFGDISNDSFCISENGNVRPIALLGAYPRKYNSTLEKNDYSLPNNDEDISCSSDVYRFAILSYKLFANDKNASPFDSDGAYVGLSDKNPRIPKYMDHVLIRSLSEKPEDRFNNAGALFKFIRNEQKKSLTGEKEKNELVSSSSEELNKVKVLNEVAIRNQGVKKQNRKRNILIFICVFLILLLFIISHEKKPSNTRNFVFNEKDFKERITLLEPKLNKIYDSEDPLMYASIVKMASQAVTQDERKLIEKFIVNRFIVFKYERVAKVLFQMFSGILNNQLPKFYEDLLMSLDNNYPIEKRITLFKQLLKKNKSLIINLSLALAQDLYDLEGYRAIFIQLLDKEFQENIDRMSFYALAISEPDSWKNYSDKMKEEFFKLSDEELVWLLPIYVKRNDEHLSELLKVVKKKNLLDKTQLSFLTIIDEIQPPKNIREILLKSGVSKIDREDISIVSKWMNIGRERIFYAMLLVLKDDKASKQDIFNSLFLISIEKTWVKNFIQYVKENEWDYRGDLATLIPYVADSKNFTKQEIIDALKKSISNLDGGAKKKFLMMLLKNSDLKIKKIIFKNFNELLGVGELVNFLSFDDKEIKKLSIKGLKDMNVDDVFILNLIIEKYEAEKDPEIKDFYRKTFWFIRGREVL